MAEEAARIRGVIAERRREKTRIEERIAAMTEELGAVQHDLDRLCAQLSLERHLPPELLSVIFIHTLPAEKNPGLDHLSSPLLLTRVSRHWRDVTLSTPNLWSSLTVLRRRYIHRSHAAGIRHLIQLWLGLSGQLPLRLVLSTMNQYKEIATAVINIVTTAAERWSHVAIYAYVRELDLYRQLCGCMPLLRHLEIMNLSDTNSGTVWDLSQDGPMLHSISLSYISLAALAPPRAQLTTVSTHGLDVAEYLEVIGSCTNLRVFKASIVADNLPLTPPSSVVQHTLLEHLSIDWTTVRRGFQLGPVFEAVSLPSLRALEVTGDSGTWDNIAFLSFLERSRCHIRSICIQRIDLTPDDMLACFSHLPTVEDLMFKAVLSLDQCVFERLAAVPDEQPLLPRLHALRLYDLLTEVHDAKLVDMIKSRWNPPLRVARLQTMELFGQEPPQLNAHAHLWRAEGMNIRVESMRSYMPS